MDGLPLRFIDPDSEAPHDRLPPLRPTGINYPAEIVKARRGLTPFT